MIPFASLGLKMTLPPPSIQKRFETGNRRRKCRCVIGFRYPKIEG